MVVLCFLPPNGRMIHAATECLCPAPINDSHLHWKFECIQVQLTDSITAAGISEVPDIIDTNFVISFVGCQMKECKS